MIYTVTFNPSLDYVASCDEFKMGKINRTTKEVIFPGGKGINVSRVLQNLGISSIVLGFIAGFTGKEIARCLHAMNCSEELIELDEGLSRINIKLKSSEETELNGMGPLIGDDAIKALLDKLDKLQSGDILILAGSIPASMPGHIYMDIMKFLDGRGIKVVVDASKSLLSNVLPYHPFLIKPNNHELGELFGVEIVDKNDVIKYARILQEKGATNVLVSMAGDGAVLVAEDGEVYESQAPTGKVINSVGAGDSMVAGFLYGYLKYSDYVTALRYGVCAGSASAFSEDLATKDKIMELYERGSE